MTEIEWLDPGNRHGPLEPVLPVAVAVRPPTSAPQAPWRRVDGVVDVLWVAAGILAFLAPFHAVYRYTLRSTSASMDGWGRYSQETGADAGVHGARTGIVVCVAVGLLAAGLVVRRAARHRVRPFAAGTIATVLALGVFGACAGQLALEFSALSSSITIETSGAAADLRPEVQSGGALWLLLAATVVGLVALVIDTAHRLRSTAQPHGHDARGEPDLLVTNPDGENL